MRTAILIFLSILVSTIASAQSVEYGYDACGNRVARQVMLGNKSLIADDQQEVSEEQLGAVQVRIYPNPTHGLLKVVLQNADEQPCSITVYSTNGKQIVHIPQAEPETDIDLTPQPNGIYLLRFATGNEISTWKILKQ